MTLINTSSATIKTIREGLIGALRDFVDEAGFDGELDLVVDLVYELAEYREEDVPFFPNVYVIKNQEVGDTLKKIAPGLERVLLRTVADKIASGSAILKDSAALAEDGWSVFIEVTDGNANVKYGLFRSESLPISISSAEHMADPTSDSGSALLVRNCSRNSVEILAPDGKRLEFSFTSAKPADETILRSFDKFSEKVAGSIDDFENRQQASGFVKRLLVRLTQKCHGTILVVISADLEEFPDELSDGVVLEEPVDILSAFADLKRDPSAHNFVRLSSRESLLRGMIQSDGITVLNSEGKILAFRVFVKATEAERKQLSDTDVRGGARSRAFEVLKLRVGNSLLAAFFRSQDGRTRCEVPDE